jgi:hypothetical protein
MGLKPVPKLLRKQIQFANIIPPPEKLPGADDQAGWVREHWESDDASIEVLKGKCPRFREYMEGADAETSPAEFVRRCHALKMTRELLHTIARTSKNKSAGQHLPIRSSFENELVYAATGQDGKLRVEHHPLLQALEGIEVSRIRECAICHQIFWAQRADQPCCTRRCAHILRTRRWRKRYPKKYKVQRYRKANAKGHIDERLEQARVEVLQDDLSRAARSGKRRK